MRYCFDLFIFDMDGVLADTSPCHRRAYEDLWRRIGIRGPEYETIAGRKTCDVIKEFTAGLKPSPEQIQEWILFKQLQARRYFSAEVITYPDTVRALTTLAKYKARLALGTSASRDSTRMILNRLGISDLFSILVTGDDVKHGKPSPEIYLKIIQKAEISPHKTLIVEDSPSGLEAAIASTAYAASVRTGKKIEHPKFIGSFSDLCELLSKSGIEVP
ncbi:MAG TPA: HAD family phosphatase [Candidatus Limnocylindrales bacterium]|nr:HAD family phosphatase [Candidatus Limnocylindrales bacterium]